MKRKNEYIYLVIVGSAIALLLLYKKKKETSASSMTNEVVNLDVIKSVLKDYNEYCQKVGWKNQFRDWTEETAKNIYTHYAVETAEGKKMVSNNTHNITYGSWSKDPYQASPYIRDFYKHKYLEGIDRSDFGQIQKFRQYESVKDSIMDYIDLINRAKRYSGIPYEYKDKDPHFIKSLGRAGYFTRDPEVVYQMAKSIKASKGWL